MRASSILALVVGAAALAQTPPRPTFEAAAIRLNKTCVGPSRSGERMVPGRLSLRCISTRSLIRSAYGLFDADGKMLARRINIVGGPDWLDRDLYDLDATAEGSPSIDKTMGPMLQTLLESRFRLKIHREARETSVYSLTVEKGGSKLKDSVPNSCVPQDLSREQPRPEPGHPVPLPCGFSAMRGTNGNIVAESHGMTMAEFAARTLIELDRPVVDKTGLAGRYDIHLEYSLPATMSVQSRLNGEAVPDAVIPSDPSVASIFSAVQKQLGLRLTADKAPIDVIVVDAVERPSEN